MTPLSDDATPPKQHRPTLTIESLRGAEDALAFRDISQEWITRLFTLTDDDRRLLDNPHEAIIAHGGDVRIARSGSAIVGCAALIAHPNAVFELSKMGVTPAAQGQGVGRQLVADAIDRARRLGGTSIFLGTNSKLQPAIHLYEQAGFKHVTADQLAAQDHVARTDTLMELPLR